MPLGRPCAVFGRRGERQARTDAPPEPYSRAALNAASAKLRRQERLAKAREDLQTVVTKTSRMIAEAKAEVAHHLAEYDANGLPGPSPAATEARRPGLV
jgi:hypothetical protein